jgi:putative superfamily III holin-X
MSTNPQRSGDLAAEVVQDVSRLVNLEIALARQELKELAIRNGIAVGLLAFGGLLCIIALLVAVPVAVVLLIAFGWTAVAVIAAAAWAAVYLVIGVALLLIGKARLRIGLPSRTIASIKETKTWALHRLRSTTR